MKTKLKVWIGIRTFHFEYDNAYDRRFLFTLFILDEYTIEYLDPEYLNTLDDEAAENDDEQQPGGERKKSAKPTVRRTYPYKCSKCSKRFVYKEVYDAHIRIHKGLPGFS